MTHRLVRADLCPTPLFDATDLVWFAVACACDPEVVWYVNYWPVKFHGPGYVGHGLYVPKDHGHRAWVCLVVTCHAWGYEDALARVQAFQDSGVPADWAWEHVQTQGRFGD